jgi:UPF0042 nucleotide-binding protein
MMAGPKRLVVVTGLSGAGKSSILRALEDLGYDTVDNPPLPLIAELVAGSDSRLAVGVDARRRGFCSEDVLESLARLRCDPALRCELVFAWADEAALLRRYTETRRRHPLAPQGRVADGIAAEERLTAPLRLAADLVLDTTDLPPADLRRRIEQYFNPEDRQDSLVVSLLSFAYPAGLPREADLVLDARFLRNPHYDAILRPKTGLDPAVGAYIEADPDFTKYYNQIKDFLALLLPRFVQEGKRYATVAVGCTGGRHRSVHIIERIALDLAGSGWRVMRSHRELAREGATPDIRTVAPVQPG